MGEVFRARATKLGRDVALKGLPDSFAKDPDRLARFQREARVLAVLNHPNVAQIHGLEESESVCALVMELVEGEDLAERLARGPMPIDEALPIARQIAEALEAAHEQGIVHRDLKPGNIKVRVDGTVKVLDFGLAKALGPDGEASQVRASLSPTLTTPAGMTGVGVLLGTAPYMAPEQARGKPVDKRADIWSFGALLYEMLSARRAFDGEDISLTLANVMKSEPDWSALPAALPAGVRTMLMRCLSKDPKQRTRDIGDVRLALDGAFEHAPAGAAATGTAPVRFAWLRALPWTVALGAAAAAVALSIRQPPAAPVARFEIELRNLVVGTDAAQAAVLSPDGRSIVYVEGEGSTSRLMRRDIDQLTPSLIAGTEQENATTPVFSPDGTAVAFISRRRNALMKVPLAGGTPLMLVERPARAVGMTPTWLGNGTIVFSRGDGLWSVSSERGAPLQLVKTELTAGGPSALPGGRALLFHVGGLAGDESSLEALVLASGERRKIVSGRNPLYLPTGHLLFARADGSLWAAPFDLNRLSITREPTPLSVAVFRQATNDAPQVSLSANGSLLYVPGQGQVAGGGLLAWVKRDGTATPVVNEPGIYDYPRLSPDGSRVAFSRRDIWVLDLGRASRTRLTFDGRVGPGRTAPSGILAWAADSQRVTFNRAGDDPAKPNGTAIAWTKVDGSDTQLLIRSDGLVTPSAWSSDGKTLAYQSRLQNVNRDVWVFEPRGDARERPFVESPAEERAPAFSPDGKWLAYVSNESGEDQIYVKPYPGPGERFTISNEGGTEPVWSRDGRELFYRDDEAMMAVPVAPGPSPSFGQPRLLFRGQFLSDFSAAAGYPFYDVARDGRFLMVQRPATVATKLVFVQNWFEELKRLVPLR